MTRPIGSGVLELLEDDIASLQVDAIVNAASPSLELGGGVAGAIRRGGGPSIQQECDRIGHCPVGVAVVTGAGTLPAKHVIHAVGPIWGQQSEAESDRLLASAAREAMARAAELGLTSVALPSISTGTYGFPPIRAARILIDEGIRHLEGRTPVRRVIFCLYGREAYESFRAALERRTQG